MQSTRVGPQCNRIGGLLREAALCLSTARGKQSTTQEESELAPETDSAGDLASSFQPLELRENTFLLFKLPNLWYFVMAAELARTYTVKVIL